MTADYIFGLKRTTSLNIVFGENHDLPEYIKFQKETELWNKNFRKFQTARIAVDVLARDPVFEDWTGELNDILEKCSNRASILLLEDFIMARDSKSMKIVNKLLQELLDNFLPIKDFVEFEKIQANGGPKEPERAQLGWYR